MILMMDGDDSLSVDITVDIIVRNGNRMVTITKIYMPSKRQIRSDQN
jgi:hypothetical protein